MKILLINNFYYYRGGDCTYVFTLKKLLEEKGHEVIVFSMRHPQNFESEYSRYFVSYINYAEEIKRKSPYSGLKVLFRSIYSLEARKNIKKILAREKPDIVHLNNIRHHITPSILKPIKKHGIPIVWTLHDYQLICPNISFLAKGRICEKCRKRRYYWPPIIRCKKGSVLASMMAAIEHTIQIISRVYDYVDVFICPSYFLRSKFAEYGFYENKLVHLNYTLGVNIGDDDRDGNDCYLYAGRISEEKGIRTLIDATLKSEYGTLKIAGDGPLLEQLSSYAQSRGGNNKIEFLGYVAHSEITELLKKSRFLIIPSEWYENFPYIVIEAFSCGKPVIGSRIGGIPELVKDGVTGLTFTPGNADDLRNKIEYLGKNPTLVAEMGKNARELVKNELSPEKHYEKLMQIYERARKMKLSS